MYIFKVPHTLKKAMGKIPKVTILKSKCLLNGIHNWRLQLWITFNKHLDFKMPLEQLVTLGIFPMVYFKV